ncbi:MAG TPA: hypothetical protein VGN51_22280 [Acidimicrobiia bacterium]|jgi:hypothetical protein
MPRLVYDTHEMRDVGQAWRSSALELADIRSEIERTWAQTQLVPKDLAVLRQVSDAILSRAAGPSSESLAARNDAAGRFLQRDADTILEMEAARAGGTGAIAAAALLTKRFSTKPDAFLNWPTWSERPLPDWAESLRMFVAGGTGTGNAVGTVTTHPSSGKADEAIRWASQRLGQDFRHGECLKFVYEAYLSAGIDIGHPPPFPNDTAYQYWTQHGTVQQHTLNPPRGALVFWGPTAGYPEGHVAISQGDGTAISTYERTTDYVHNLVIAERNQTHPYLGWMMPEGANT